MVKRIKYTIYQLQPTEKNWRRLFMSLNATQDTINLEEEGYKKVFIGYLKGRFRDSNEILERIFVKLNINHPKNFRGHSLSVSDVVQLSDKYFHCQSCGWKKVRRV